MQHKVKLKLIKLNHFKNWTQRLPIKEDPLYYDHLIYFRDEITDLVDTVGQTRTAQLLCLSQTKLSHTLTILRLLPSDRPLLSLGRPTLDDNLTTPFTSMFDYVDWTKELLL